MNSHEKVVITPWKTDSYYTGLEAICTTENGSYK